MTFEKVCAEENFLTWEGGSNSKTNETAELIIFHNEELRNLYFPQNILVYSLALWLYSPLRTLAHFTTDTRSTLLRDLFK
jgi:hypothetical protein